MRRGRGKKDPVQVDVPRNVIDQEFDRLLVYMAYDQKSEVLDEFEPEDFQRQVLTSPSPFEQPFHSRGSHPGSVIRAQGGFNEVQRMSEYHGRDPASVSRNYDHEQENGRRWGEGDRSAQKRKRVLAGGGKMKSAVGTVRAAKNMQQRFAEVRRVELGDSESGSDMEGRMLVNQIVAKERRKQPEEARKCTKRRSNALSSERLPSADYADTGAPVKARHGEGVRRESVARKLERASKGQANKRSTEEHRLTMCESGSDIDGFEKVMNEQDANRSRKTVKASKEASFKRAKERQEFHEQQALSQHGASIYDTERALEEERAAYRSGKDRKSSKGTPNKGAEEWQRGHERHDMSESRSDVDESGQALQVRQGAHGNAVHRGTSKGIASKKGKLLQVAWDRQVVSESGTDIDEIELALRQEEEIMRSKKRGGYRGADDGKDGYEDNRGRDPEWGTAFGKGDKVDAAQGTLGWKQKKGVKGKGGLISATAKVSLKPAQRARKEKTTWAAGGKETTKEAASTNWFVNSSLIEKGVAGEVQGSGVGDGDDSAGQTAKPSSLRMRASDMEVPLFIFGDEEGDKVADAERDTETSGAHTSVMQTEDAPDRSSGNCSQGAEEHTSAVHDETLRRVGAQQSSGAEASQFSELSAAPHSAEAAGSEREALRNPQSGGQQDDTEDEDVGDLDALFPALDKE